MSKLRSILFILVVGALTACESDQKSSLNDGRHTSNTKPSLKFKITGLEPGNGQHYEGWVVGSGGVLSTGRFNIDNSGNTFSVNANGNSISNIGTNNVANFEFFQPIADGDTFVLTIEPDGDSDAGPSSIHYVGGNFQDSRAVATTDHSSSIGADFSTSTGSYILATPSNGPSTHNQGIWFLNAGAPSLVLPQLNNGWAYEGWVVNTATGKAISTGVFFDASGTDSDGAGPTAGANGAPPFPGQDFINPARILNNGNYVTVISVEPFPDFDPAPFTLKILKHAINLEAAVTTPFSLENFSNQLEISIEVSVN